MVATVTSAILEGWVGKGIEDICDNDFVGHDQNHCAHFVSHVYGLKYGMVCGGMKYETRGTGASIRCDEVYNSISKRGTWDKAPQNKDGLLVFVTSAGNVQKNIMANVPQKHVGICFGGKVYNFGNGEHKVRVEPTVEAFRIRLGGAYKDSKIPLFFAELA